MNLVQVQNINFISLTLSNRIDNKAGFPWEKAKNCIFHLDIFLSSTLSSSSVSAVRVDYLNSPDFMPTLVSSTVEGHGLVVTIPLASSGKGKETRRRVVIPVTPATNFWLKSTIAFLSDPFWLALSAVCQTFTLKKTGFRKQVSSLALEWCLETSSGIKDCKSNSVYVRNKT